ncbi:MAG TPA: hypothetical protein VIL85_27170 [Thermomicrobiales bacterium]
MKLGWHRAAPNRPVPLAAARLATPAECAEASQATRVREQTVGEQTETTSQLLGAELPQELRLLCQGLVNCSWCNSLRATSTDVGLPGDREHALTLRALCWDLAEEFGLEQMVRRQDQTWIVRFSQREVGMAATEEEGERSGHRADSPIPRGVARPDEAPRHLHGPRFRGRAYLA